MKSLMPMANLPGLRKEMDRLFDRFWEGNGFEISEVGAWVPYMDVWETKDALTIELEIPGLDPKDVQVTVRNGVLTLTGEKKHQYEQKDERHYRMERTYGSFERSVRLPIPVDETKVKAIFKNGVLSITLPKTAEAKGTTVPVQQG